MQFEEQGMGGVSFIAASHPVMRLLEFPNPPDPPPLPLPLDLGAGAIRRAVFVLDAERSA